MKKTICFINLIITVCLFMGCDIENINVSGEKSVVAIGVDYLNEEYKVSIIVFSANDPTDFSSSENFEHTEIQKPTIIEAFNEINKQKLDSLFYKQNKILVLGSGIEDQNMIDSVLFLVQNKYVEANTNVFYSDNAYEVLKSNEDEILEIERFNEMLDIKSKSANFGFPIYNLLNQFETKSETLFLPYIELTDKAENSAGDRIEIDSVAFFKDFDFVEITEDEQKQAIMLLNDGLIQTKFVTEINSKQNQIFLEDMSCKMMADFINNQLLISIKSSAKTAVGSPAITKQEIATVEQLSNSYLENLAVVYFEFLVEHEIQNENNIKFYLNLIDKDRFNDMSIEEILDSGAIKLKVDVEYFK